MKKLLILIVISMSILSIFMGSIAGAVEEEKSTGVLPFTVALGYEQWQVNWYVDGFSYDIDTNVYQSRDYKIDPTLISGMFVSTSSKNTGNNSWNLSLKAYGDYIKQNSEDRMDSHVKYLKALFSYGLSSNTVLLSQYQYGVFHGELVGNTVFDSEFKKLDILFCGTNSHRTGGIGFRFLEYNMPVEYAFVEHKTGRDLGHAVYKTDTKGVSVLISSKDPIVLGYDNDKLFYMDYDCAFGISNAKAKELIDNVYGFQFNFDVDAGIKKAFHLGHYGLIAVKAGYRVFFDGQILAEWKGSDDKNTTSTLRNYFHGPFVSVMGAF